MIIIGGGVAGLMAALAAAPRPVTILAPGGLGVDAASLWSQGGIAAVTGADDSIDQHIADTLAAGAGLCDPAAVRRIIGAGPQIIETLERSGVRFDRDAAGDFARGREAAHSRHRILHANGDQTGAEMMRGLIAAVKSCPSITILDAKAAHIFAGDSGVNGVLAARGGSHISLPSDRVLLATGGIGGLYRDTTNPPGAVGTGLMLAMKTGAKLKNIEFVQFHPTALNISASSMPLISEAVRGDGAILVDETGYAFMRGQDLAPRDVVSRAVFAHHAVGHRVFLDARMIKGFPLRFPGIFAICARYGIDPVTQPIPVRPAAHYHMGGIVVDENGQTNVRGLFAAGEVACTGLHGANRLASNSLLEAAVCGAQAGRVMAAIHPRQPETLPDVRVTEPPDVEALRDLMSAHVGVLRDEVGLKTVIASFEDLAGKNEAAQLCLRIAQAALARRASVGAHARRDEPAAIRKAA